MDYYEQVLWNVRAGTQNVDGMLMYYVPTIPGGWKTFGSQFDTNWCCTGTGFEEYAKLVDTLYFHDENSVYVNQFVASDLSWPEKGIRLVQQTAFPDEERTSITVHAEHPTAFALRLRAPHWAENIAVSVNGRLEKVAKQSDGYLVLERTWKTGDRVEMSLPMKLRQEQVPDSPDLAAVAYGPLVLAARMGRDGLSQDMIDNNQGPDLGRLATVPTPRFEAAKAGFWVKKNDDEELSFSTVGQLRNMELSPLSRILDERYSVYWQQAHKA
jgi:DUF1680 family protein